MTNMDRSSPRKEAKRITNKTRTVLLVYIGIGLAFISSYLIFAIRINSQKQGLEDVFNFLEQQGYVINHGFSGIYQPGAIVQVAEMVKDRRVPLAAPILVISAASCFPGKEPERYPFTLPHYSGTSTADLKAGAKSAAALIPGLALDSNTVANYSLKLGAIQTVVYAKLDLSRKFSAQCVNDLQNALADGDRLDWFKVINEAVVADSVSFEIIWQSGASTEARKNVEHKVSRKIAHIAQSNSKGKATGEITCTVQVDTNKKFVLEARGNVILAYKVRPLDKQKIASNDGIHDQPSAKISAEKKAVQGINEDKTKIAVQLIRQNASRVVRFDHPFVKGDKFRFEIIPNHDGSLYIFHHKPGENLELLWPRPEKLLARQQGHPVQRGKALEIPPSPAHYYFDEELTEELFYVALVTRKNQSSLQKDLNNFIVRGNRRLGYDSGQDPQNPYLYFSELLMESHGQVVEFRLGR